jgi:hypothetical protein
MQLGDNIPSPRGLGERCTLGPQPPPSFVADYAICCIPSSFEGFS